MSPEGIILVGHGRKALDTPATLIEEYQRGRLASSRATSSASSERRIREWPRTPQTDPYKAGLERIAEALRKELPESRVALAFNEFCAPTIAEAARSLIDEGVTDIALISTMMTPGGSHAEHDLPMAVGALRDRYSDVRFRYDWPIPVESIGRFLAEAISSTGDHK